MLQMSYCGLLCIYNIYIIYIYIYLYTHIYICVCVVELCAPAMPFGLEAFVAVKLRSLRWQHRFEQGWYFREAEGYSEQQR